jgi:uroporphyrinogen-III synthase
MRIPVVITRPHGPYAGAKHLQEALSERGFAPFHFPVLSCERRKLNDGERSLISNALGNSKQWIVFLSPTAVAVFRDLLASELGGVALPTSVRIAVQGTGTQGLVQECFGREADFVPSVFVAEQFAEEFCVRFSSDAQVLVAQSSEGRNIFAQTLKQRGYAVTTVDTYSTKPVVPSPEVVQEFLGLSNSGTAFLLFMSPSAVNATVAALKGHESSLRNMRIVSVGPITTRAIKKHGLSVAAEAAEHSESGVVQALIELGNVCQS